jgi:predicted GIY-YIG superfamily endonuclease
MARRLRQHNGELPGGAWYTAQRGSGWRVRHVVSGFRSKHKAMSFESRIQFATRRCKTDAARERHYKRLLLERPHLTLDQ